MRIAVAALDLGASSAHFPVLTKLQRGPVLPVWVIRCRQRLEYAAFRLVAFVFTTLPLETASSFSAWGWRTIAPWLPRHKRALANLKLAFPEKSDAERERIARAMWASLGHTFGEFFHMEQILAEKRIAMEPPEFFEAIAKGPPFVICALHLGNWEISSQLGLRIGLPIAGADKRSTLGSGSPSRANVPRRPLRQIVGDGAEDAAHRP